MPSVVIGRGLRVFVLGLAVGWCWVVRAQREADVDPGARLLTAAV
jgi:hypothetical protein